MVGVGALDELGVVVIQIVVFHEIAPIHSVVGVVLEAAIQEIEAFKRHFDVFGKSVISFFQILFEVFFVCPCKWRKAGYHFVKDRAKAPNIYFAAVRLTLEDLWSHVQRSSAHRPCQVGVFQLLREAKIGNHDVDITNKRYRLFVILKLHAPLQNHLTGGVLKVHKNIGQLQIPMQDIHFVYGLEPLHDLADEVSGFLFHKAASEVSQTIEVAAVTILHE